MNVVAMYVCMYLCMHATVRQASRQEFHLHSYIHTFIHARRVSCLALSLFLKDQNSRPVTCPTSIWEFPKIGDPNIVGSLL